MHLSWSRVRWFALVALASLAPLHAGFLGFGAPSDADVNVVVDVTEDGKKFPLPTKEHPAFYFPVLAGYKEMGSLVAGEKSPPNNFVAHLLAKALLSEHYIVTGVGKPAPSVILVFHWGYMNPQIDETSPGDPTSQTFWNEREMLALVAGNTLNNISPMGFEREDILQAARDDRYFVIVSAYDFEAAKTRKKKLLWQAKMSTPSNRVALAEVIPSMITAGAPHFGKETKRPESVTAPLAKEGRVDVGTPVVVPDKDKPAPKSDEKK